MNVTNTNSIASLIASQVAASPKAGNKAKDTTRTRVCFELSVDAKDRLDNMASALNTTQQKLAETIFMGGLATAIEEYDKAVKAQNTTPAKA